MLESIQLALAKTCLCSAALLLSALAGWKALKCLAWILPLIERKSFRFGVLGAVVCLGGLCVCISYGGSKTNSPPDGAANLPRLIAGSCAPSGEPDPVGSSGLQITEFTYQTNGVTLGSCWSPDIWLTGLGLFHSPFVNSNDWTKIEEWGVPRGATNDVRYVPFGGSFTNAAAGFFMLRGYPDPERALYTTIEIVRLSPYGDGEVSVTYEDSLGTHVETFVLEVGATNVVPVRIGRRYTVSPVDSNRIAVRSDDPCVRFSEGEQFWLLDVCRPVKVVLTDRPPPEDAARCLLGHAHARYCDFTTDPAIDNGVLTLYDTYCLTVDNSNRILRIQSPTQLGHWNPDDDDPVCGVFTEPGGAVDLVYDDFCLQRSDGSLTCLCGVGRYCPDCIGSTAAWYNLMFPDLLTATNAPDGSVSLSWHDGVASNAYYFVELMPTNHSRRFTITPRLPTMTRDYVVQASSGMKVRIPLLAGVPYTVLTDYGGFTVTPETGDVVVARDSPRSFTVERPLTFGATRNVALELRCSSGHVHTRRYRVVTNIPDIPGTVEIDETKCLAAADGDGFAVTCDGIRGDGCAAEDVVTGRFVYEGVTKSFAITNSEFCVCDNLHHPTCPCGADSLCDGCDTTIYGQGADWVRMNFDRLRGLDPALDDADDILRYGYASWVNRRVGYGLENGLYKLTATFTNTPSGTVWLDVGELTVAVTNAGEYVFLLEKGVDYYFDTYPRAHDVIYSTRDDLAAPLLFAALSGGVGAQSGLWTLDGGTKELSQPVDNNAGHSLQMPKLTATPDVIHLYPDDFPITFSAVLTDYYRMDLVSYQWSCADRNVWLSAPNASETSVSAFPTAWREAVMSVEASFGTKSLTSSLRMTYGTEEEPLMDVLISPSHVWVNQPANEANKRTVAVRFVSDIPTNGTLEVSFIGDGSRLGLSHASKTWAVNSMMHMSRDNPQEFVFGLAEGIAPSVSVDGEKFECRFIGSEGTLVWTNAITVAKVASVELWSEKGGDSTRYLPPFPGQATATFCITNSASPDQHYPVFFCDVVDTNFCVQPYSVEYRVSTLPVNLNLSGATTSLTRLEGPQSGTLRNVLGKTAYFDTPSDGGVYKIGVTYADSPVTETILLLPLAGAAVDDVVLADRALADMRVEYINSRYGRFERQTPGFGLRWFNNNGMGDYLGRVDSLSRPTVWPYNQVNDETGMGAVATWRGLPIRISKVSNFLVGYTTERIGVWGLSMRLSQGIGTSNDESATMSWNAGVSIADGANFDSTTGAVVSNAWSVSDQKERRLWPNSSSADNHTTRTLIRDYNLNFISPGFTERIP